MPEIDEVRKQFEPQGVGFLALTMDANTGRVGEVVSRLKLGIQVGVAETDMLTPFGIRVVPATLFVDRQGRVVATAEGEQSRTFFEVEARDLLQR